MRSDLRTQVRQEVYSFDAAGGGGTGITKAELPKPAVEDIWWYADLRGAYTTLHGDKIELEQEAKLRDPPHLLYITDSSSPNPPRPNSSADSLPWRVSILELGTSSHSS